MLDIEKIRNKTCLIKTNIIKKISEFHILANI